MLQIVQAYDRRPIAELATEDADALEAKLETASRTFRDFLMRKYPRDHVRK